MDWIRQRAEALFARLRVAGERRRKSRSQMMRAALERYLSNHRTITLMSPDD